jgi:RNA polymerase sigma-70 factor (ECF subfamily)
MVHALGVADEIASSVVAAAATGDVLALERIIARHHRDMARVCVVICGGDADLAEDAVQAAWTIVWRKLHTLRDADRLRPWLVSVAANEARHLVRRQRPVAEIAVADAGSDRDDPAAGAAVLDLRAAVRRLDADERTLLALRHVAGFDSSEIGRAIGMTPSGVRTKLERLLGRLRRELGDE